MPPKTAGGKPAILMGYKRGNANDHEIPYLTDWLSKIQRECQVEKVRLFLSDFIDWIERKFPQKIEEKTADNHAIRVLFEELIKHPDDVALFDTMREGFQSFFEETCMGYWKEVFFPMLQGKIKQENLALNLSREDDSLFKKKTPFLTISCDHWSKMQVVFLTDDINVKNLFYRVENVPEELKIRLMKALDKLHVHIGTNYHKPYLEAHKAYESRVWQTNETFLALQKALKQPKSELSCPIAKEYIDRLWLLVKTVDETVREM